MRVQTAEFFDSYHDTLGTHRLRALGGWLRARSFIRDGREQRITWTLKAGTHHPPEVLNKAAVMARLHVILGGCDPTRRSTAPPANPLAYCLSTVTYQRIRRYGTEAAWTCACYTGRRGWFVVETSDMLSVGEMQWMQPDNIVYLPADPFNPAPPQIVPRDWDRDSDDDDD